MSDVNFIVFLIVIRSGVEISWTFSGACYVVVGPLAHNWEGEQAVKEIFVQLVGGGALMGENRGRAAPLKTKTFDDTLGFPGEDVTKQPQLVGLYLS